MLNTTLKPMRKIVGDSIPIESISVLFSSDAVEGIAPVVTLHSDLEGIFEYDQYSEFLPHKVCFEDVCHRLPTGAATYPEPTGLPFGEVRTFASISWLSDTVMGLVDASASRSMWIEFRIKLDVKQPCSVGGICYSGYPYLPYYLTPQGENSANFGLPREIRLTLTQWPRHSADMREDLMFIDAEDSVTNQEPTSHSGIHVFSTGPVLTDELILRLSDFPRIINSWQVVNGKLEVAERWGFIIPLLSVFEYKESVRYAPAVPAGLLGAVRASRSDEARIACIDHFQLIETTDPGGDRAFPLSAASVFGQHREYVVRLPRTDVPLYEHFVSDALNQHDCVLFFIEQAEEFCRSLAGIRLWLESHPPHSTDPIPKLPRADLGVRIYELDPVEGLSPVDYMTDLEANRYANCIFKGRMSDFGFGDYCKFNRPSSTRYFVIALECLDTEGGHIVIREIQLVQSAHVSIVPRPSRTQLLKALHFRLVGPGLADDYSRLGEEGFSFAVEHLAAGECKEVLFEASSLLDVLQSGTARLYSNHRRYSVEQEVIKTQDGSYNVQKTEGWSRSETGLGTVPSEWKEDIKKWGTFIDETQGMFRALGNQEIRTHTTHVGEMDEDLIDIVNRPPGWPDIDSDADALWKVGGTGDAVWRPWGNRDNWVPPNLKQRLKVRGIWNSNMPPNFWTMWQLWRDRLSFSLGQFIADPTDTDKQNNLNEALTLFWKPDVAAQCIAVNGFGIGFNAGVAFIASLGGSVSSTIGIPTLLLSNSIGSSGTIVEQAYAQGYSYAQHLNKGRMRTDFPEGVINREITRYVAPNSLKRIRGAEVMWQDELVDIVIGSVPLGITLPATASKMYRTTDDSLRVRFSGGVSAFVNIDVWFDIVEEVVRDDY